LKNLFSANTYRWLARVAAKSIADATANIRVTDARAGAANVFTLQQNHEGDIEDESLRSRQIKYRPRSSQQGPPQHKYLVPFHIRR
jgi:hypothetical protein